MQGLCHHRVLLFSIWSYASSACARKRLTTSRKVMPGRQRIVHFLLRSSREEDESCCTLLARRSIKHEVTLRRTSQIAVRCGDKIMPLYPSGAVSNATEPPLPKLVGE